MLNADDQRDRCEHWQHEILTAKYQPTAKPPRDPAVENAFEEAKGMFRRRPGKAIPLLRQSGSGCRWLAQRLRSIRDRLKTFRILPSHDLTSLLHLHGLPFHTGVDPLIFDFRFHGLMTRPDPPQIELDRVLDGMCPTLRDRYLEKWKDPDANCEEVLRHIEEAIAELEDRIGQFEAYEEWEKHAPAKPAMMIQDQNDARLCLRYFKESDSTFFRSLQAYWKDQDRRATEAAEVDEDDPADSSDVGPSEDLADRNVSPIAEAAPQSEDEPNRQLVAETIEAIAQDTADLPPQDAWIVAQQWIYGLREGAVREAVYAAAEAQFPKGTRRPESASGCV